MNKKWIVGILVALGLCAFWIGSVRAGGWAVLTLESWPGEVVAGEPFMVRYVLRQHGKILVEYEGATITTVNEESGERIRFKVQPTTKVGYYEAEMTLPEPGTWQWSIDAFGQFDMPPLIVVEGTAVPIPTTVQSAQITIPATTNYWIIMGMGMLAIVLGFYLWFRKRVRFALVLGLIGMALCLVGIALVPTNHVETAVAQPINQTIQPSAEMGQILFVAKGCTTCHHHDKITNKQSIGIGSNLTHRDVSAEFLRLWLRDPVQMRPETQMPNLELTDAEIEALLAFLLADKTIN